MSLTDLGGIFQGAALPAQIQGQQTQNQQNALNLMQQQRALSALRGIDINDPESAQRGINALAGLGQIDAANALTNLAFTRGVKSATLPLVQESIDQARQSQKEQAQGQGQPDIEKQGRLLTEANTALGDIMSTSDPVARQQKAQAWKAHFLGENVPEDAIDGVVGDLSDQGLMAHQANIQREMQQFQVTHSPGYQQAAGALESGLANPIVMGTMEAAGIPTAAGVAAAANITSPLRGAQVQAAYAPQIAGGVTAATEAAKAPYELVPNVTGPNGEPLYRSTAEFAASRPGGPPLAGGAVPGAFPSQGAGPATVEAARVGGNQAQSLFNADNATAAGMQATVTPLRQILDKLPTTNIGPGTEQTNELRSFVIAQLPWLTKLDPTYWNAAKIQTAQYNELKKYMTQVATTGLNGVFGQGSDQRFAAIVSGNPHITMDQLSAKQVTELAMAGVRAQAAAPLVFARQGLPVTAYPTWKANFGSTVDPRGFMLDILSPTERKAMLAQIPRGSTEAENLKRAKGYAEQVGMYQDSDIPR